MKLDLKFIRALKVWNIRFHYVLKVCNGYYIYVINHVYRKFRFSRLVVYSHHLYPPSRSAICRLPRAFTIFPLTRFCLHELHFCCRLIEEMGMNEKRKEESTTDFKKMAVTFFFITRSVLSSWVHNEWMLRTKEDSGESLFCHLLFYPFFFSFNKYFIQI